MRLENGAPLVGSVLGSFSRRSSIGSIQREGQFVERGLQRERADRLAGGAHPGVGYGVEMDDLLTDEEVVRRVEMACRKGALLGVAGMLRRRRDSGVHERDQPAIGLCPQRDALFRNRPPADDAIHLLARQRKADGPVDDFRRRGAEHAVLPQPGLSAKAAADERRVHLDVLWLEREDLGERRAESPETLRRVPDGQVLAVTPHRHGRMRFDRIVVVPGRAIETSTVTAAVARAASGSPTVTSGGSPRISAGTIASDFIPSNESDPARSRSRRSDQRRGILRLLEGVGDDDGDGLAIPADAIVLKDRQVAGRARLSVAGIEQARRLQAGALAWVSTAMTPGAASAAAISIAVTRPLAMRLHTSAAWTRLSAANSARTGPRR